MVVDSWFFYIPNQFIYFTPMENYKGICKAIESLGVNNRIPTISEETLNQIKDLGERMEKSVYGFREIDHQIQEVSRNVNSTFLKPKWNLPYGGNISTGVKSTGYNSSIERGPIVIRINIIE